MYVECSSKEMRGVDGVFQLAVNTAVATEQRGWDGRGTSGNPFGNSGGNGGGGSGGGKRKKRSCKIL